MSVLAALTFMCFLSTFLFETYSAPAKMNTVKVVVKHVPDYSASREKNDLGMDFFTPGRQKILEPNYIKKLSFRHSMAMSNLNKIKETTPMTTKALKVAP